MKLVQRLVLLAFLATAAVGSSAQDLLGERRTGGELHDAFSRMVAEGARLRGEARPQKLAQSSPCKRLGGKPEAPVCGGTCANGGQCDINFPAKGLPNCACQ